MILIILIQNGDDEIVKVLVEAGADIDIQNQYLNFPLQLAAGVSTYIYIKGVPYSDTLALI